MTKSDNAKQVGIIPARAGSQGLPGKNTRELGGKPLICYTIEAALRCNSISRVVVSSNDEMVESVCKSYDVMFVRQPEEVSTPCSPTVDALRWLAQSGSLYRDEVDLTVLRATSPLRNAEDIEGALAFMRLNSEADSLVSVSELGVDFRRIKLLSGNYLTDIEDEGGRPVRRQEIKKMFIRNGAIYLTNTNIIGSNRMWGNLCLGYIMPQERSININTNFDWNMAEVALAEAATVPATVPGTGSSGDIA